MAIRFMAAEQLVLLLVLCAAYSACAQRCWCCCCEFRITKFVFDVPALLFLLFCLADLDGLHLRQLITTFIVVVTAVAVVAACFCF